MAEEAEEEAESHGCTPERQCATKEILATKTDELGGLFGLRSRIVQVVAVKLLPVIYG